MAEGRQGCVYLTWQTWSYSKREAVESSGGRRVRLHRSISIHLIDIRQPEVLLRPQARDGDEKAEDRRTVNAWKSHACTPER